MILETDHDYHMRRALAELGLAYRSECRAAMESHLRLSSLHMRQLRAPASAVRPAGLQSFLRNLSAVFALRPSGRKIEARENEAVSG
jgi:hypothetical protein